MISPKEPITEEQEVIWDVEKKINIYKNSFGLIAYEKVGPLPIETPFHTNLMKRFRKEIEETHAKLRKSSNRVST